jgi:ATP-dependent Clp protease ATP-binding subunit ClpA
MNLTLPILVQEWKRPGTGTPAFVVRPLFAAQPYESDVQLGRAITKLARSLRTILDAAGRSMRHDAPGGLADWTFNPDVREHAISANVELKSQTAHLRFLVVAFHALDRTIAFVPAAVPELWFDVPRGATVNERAQDAVTAYLKRLEKQEDSPGDFKVPLQLTRESRAWLSTVELDVTRKPRLDVADPDLPKFLSLGGGEKADGREELIKVGRCLDWLYPEDLDRAAHRDAEVAELLRLLSAADRRPVLLVGPPRSGKTTVVHECVYRRVARRGGSAHVAKENVWLLAPQRLISGMMYVGQWEERLLAILGEARKRDHVLYFDDLLGLFRAGVAANSDLNVAQVMRAHVERREFRMLGEITPDALRVMREQDRGFADLFHLLPINGTPEPVTRRILMDMTRQLEGRHRCAFHLDALPTVMDLQNRYVRDLASPGKAAGFLRELAMRYENAEITRHRVLDAFQARSGLAVTFLDTAARLERDEVVKNLSANLVGQDAAVQAMADAVTVAKARLNDPGRPLATLLFLGPTGVGKTQAAKALARYLFGEAGAEQRLVRFDMNEYVEPGSAARLVGTFRDPEGLLTSRVRRQPFAVLLLDEIEKADPGVFDLLLQVLGEGRLTDALGRTADFSNCVVIMTSNLGVREAGGRFGLRPAGASSAAASSADRGVFVAAAERFFRPEFFNRIDRVVPFESLSREHVTRIADTLIADVFRRDGLLHRRCALRVEPEAMRKIVEDGYHPQLGARALKRSIERALTRPVAARLAALAHDAPAVVTLYAAGRDRGLSSHVEPLVNATPLDASAAKPLDTTDPGDALDRIEDAVTRIEHDLELLQPARELRQDELSPAHFRYLALREHTRHLRRQIDRIDRLLDQRRRPSVTRGGVRNPSPVPRTRKVVRRNPVLAPVFWRDVMSAEDSQARLAELSETGDGGPLEEIDASLVELAQDTALLQAMAAADSPDACLMLFRGVGAEARVLAPVLGREYDDVFDPRFHQFAAERFTPEQVRSLTDEPVSLTRIDMPGAYGIFAGETGTHLLLTPDGRTLVRQVFVYPLASGQSATEMARELFARHAAWRAGLADGSTSITDDPFGLAPVARVGEVSGNVVDLRSGAVTFADPTPLQMRRLILAALPVPEELIA